MSSENPKEARMYIFAPQLLNREVWDFAAGKMPGKELQYIIGSTLFNDIESRTSVGTCIVVLVDIANFYPERMEEMEEAFKGVLIAVEGEGYNKAEISKALAYNFNRLFMSEFSKQGIELGESDKLRFSRQEQIHKMLSRFAEESK